jgi:hypothetical protein
MKVILLMVGTMSLHKMQNLMVLILEKMGTIGYYKLMIDNNTKIMMNNINCSQFFFW